MSRLRWVWAALLLVLLLLQWASVPFYAGGSITGRIQCRFEHGRIMVQRSDFVQHEQFYVAINSEGLRWAPDWAIYSRGAWFLKVPLWTLYVPALVLTVASWARHVRQRRRQRADHCSCGYDLRGLAAGAVKCPECGTALRR